MAAITITPETTRIDLLDALAQECFGITDPDAMPVCSSDVYRWRWICDELVQAMSVVHTRDLMEFVARMHDVEVLNVSE